LTQDTKNVINSISLLYCNAWFTVTRGSKNDAENHWETMESKNTTKKRGVKKQVYNILRVQQARNWHPKGAFLVWLWYNIVVLDKLLITFLFTDKLNSFMYHTF